MKLPALTLGLLPLMAQQPFGPVAGPIFSNYAATPTLYSRAGQLMRSTDGGATWAAAPILPLGSRQPVIRALAADRNDPAVIYAGLHGADGALLKSADRGQTWTSASKGLPAGANATALLTAANNDLYAQAGNQIFRSRDRAASWELMGALPTGTNAWDITRAVPANQYAIAGTKVWRSGDGGVSWKAVSPPPVYCLNSFSTVVADPVNPNLVYVGERGPHIVDVGVYVSGDGGATPPVYHRRMGKNRLEAFSDGVIAIIITIMVLELKAPRDGRVAALGALTPVFSSYVLSFIYVGIYWSNHHHLLHTAKRVNGAILWANLHLLFWLSLFPFATAWIGENHAAPAPTAFYGAVLLLAAIAYFLLQRAIMARDGGRASVLASALGRDWKGKLSPLVYLAAIPLAFVNPWISNALYVTIALVWLVPDRRIERALQSNES